MVPAVPGGTPHRRPILPSSSRSDRAADSLSVVRIETLSDRIAKRVPDGSISNCLQNTATARLRSLAALLPPRDEYRNAPPGHPLS